MTRLSSLDSVPKGVQRPGYTPERHGVGIVHIGLGAFHKAHQAVYTDDALAAEGGNWRIIGVSLRNAIPADELTPQNGLYTVIERNASGTKARVVGALAGAVCLKTERDAVLAELTAPETRIVSITVTEKGYGIDRVSGGIDHSHPAIVADLADPENPVGLAGLLVWALGQRHAAGIEPFTVLSCDNLPDNGSMVRGLLVDFARHAAPKLVDFIANDVAFPATMVDRITPARGAETLALAQHLTGHRDAAAVECESFRQWVVEDEFPTGRPAWEAGGAIFVKDVAPFEDMKLRMLNGTHSMMAYAGYLSGHEFIRDVMADPALLVMVRRHLNAAAKTLDALEGVDFEKYARDLENRFCNPHLDHATRQIAMDGTQKMPQRIFAPALVAMARGQSLESFTFATAIWIRYTLGRSDSGELYTLHDPRERDLHFAGDWKDADAVVDHVLELPALCPDELRESKAWRSPITNHLARMIDLGVAAAIREVSGLE